MVDGALGNIEASVFKPLALCLDQRLSLSLSLYIFIYIWTLSLLALYTVCSQNTGAKANWCVKTFCVKTTVSNSKLHQRTNAITEISKVGAQLLEWQVKLYLRTCTSQQYVQMWGSNGCTGKRLHTLPSHPTLGELQGFHLKSTNKLTKRNLEEKNEMKGIRTRSRRLLIYQPLGCLTTWPCWLT